MTNTKMILALILILFSPTSHVEQAEKLLKKLPRSASAYLRKGAEGFDSTRNLRIQAELFREDLIWQSRGFTTRQIDLMVFVSVALSLDNAGKALEEARKDPKHRTRVKRIERYLIQSEVLLAELSEKIRDISDQELRFHF